MVNQISTKVLSPGVSKSALKCSLYFANPYRSELKCSKTNDEMRLKFPSLRQFRTNF